MNRAILFATIVLVTASGAGQGLNIADFEPLLLPIATGGLQHGAHDTMWQAELFIRNQSDQAVIFGPGEPLCLLESCTTPYATIPPLTTVRYELPKVPDIPFFGGLYYVERSRSRSITMSLRLLETSRNPAGLGTNIPIIREDELIDGTIQLLNVTLSPLHRINVRIFEVDRAGRPEVMVRIFSGDTLIWAEQRRLLFSTDAPFSEEPAENAVLGVENQLPPSACCDPVRIEIEPLKPGRYWAYATIINNVTQEVSLITPE